PTAIPATPPCDPRSGSSRRSTARASAPSTSTASSRCTRRSRRSYRSGRAARWPSFTRAARPTRRARTSTRRTTWRAAQRGSRARPTDGWGRAIRTRSKPPSPFRAVAMGGALPRTLQGDVGAISMQSIERFDVRADGDPRARQSFEALYEQGVRDLLHGTGRETFEAVKMLRSANAARISPAHGADYPRGPFGE